MMQRKPKILYIAGAGRSGSTMLTLILSQHADVANLGQIRDLFFARAQDATCSCGCPLTGCAFWGPVAPGLHRSEAQRLPSLPDHVVRRVYANACQRARSPVVVDSSKSADLCAMLRGFEEFDVFVLNLIRDPRAVAASWSRVLQRSDVLRRRCRNWVTRQRRLAQLAQADPARFLQVSYEGFCAAPFDEVARIQHWLGVPRDLSMFLGPRTVEVNWQDQHLFPPANPGVLQRRESPMEIRESTRWRGAEYADVRHLAERICFPFASRYGYRHAVLN